jgi:hypothetical protein
VHKKAHIQEVLGQVYIQCMLLNNFSAVDDNHKACVTVSCHLYQVQKLSEGLLLSSEVGTVCYIQCTLLNNFGAADAKNFID